MYRSQSRLRRRIAWEAARLLYDRRQSQYQRARLAAARRCSGQPVRPADLPSRGEIRDALRRLAMGGAGPHEMLRSLRLAALDLMTHLRPYRPRLVGPVLTGRAHSESPVVVHAFDDQPQRVRQTLETIEGVGQAERIERGDGKSTRALAIFQVQLPACRGEIWVYPLRLTRARWRSRRTGRTMPQASARELRQLLLREDPDARAALDHTRVPDEPSETDRFALYRTLLAPLEHVRQSPQRHPEGDALYHSLQVFELARDQLPYDEEFLLAALLHDVGKAIDPKDALAAGLEALDGHITARTRWLIENQPAARAIREGTIGARAFRRLQETEDFDELMLLFRCDRHGRQKGVRVVDVDDALQYIRDLAGMCGE
jgi:hypothetical protein